jgi:hypothetical protein
MKKEKAVSSPPSSPSFAVACCLWLAEVELLMGFPPFIPCFFHFIFLTAGSPAPNCL